MEKSVEFNIAALILMCLLLLSVMFRKMTSGAVNRMFLFSVVCAIGAASFNIWTTMLDNSGIRDPFALYFSHTGYLLLHNFQPVLYVAFLVGLTDTWHKLLKRPYHFVFLILPYSISLLSLVTNPFTHLVFTVEGGYHHGKLFYLLYICAVPYVLLVVWYLIRYRSQFTVGKLISLLSMLVLSVIAIVFHLLVPSQQVECFAIALSLVIVSVGVQRPEDFIDSFTGLLKHSAYAYDMRRAYANGKHVNVIMLNIGNYNAIQSMLGYDLATDMLMRVADRIRDIDRKLRCRAAIYYLDRGRYRVVFGEKSRSKAEAAASLLMNELKMRSCINGFDVNITPFIVLARCPEEIESFKSLMSFGQIFHEKHPYTGQVMQASEVYDRSAFAIQNNIDAIIDRALNNRSFEVFYQPIYSITQGRFVSAEALLRLCDEEHGYISPEILVPAAEKSGAIHKIGDFVFEEVCKFVSGSEFKTLRLDYIEVNLSVAQCMQFDLADKILAVMKKYGVSPDSINLEITETAASYAQRVMTENLNKLSRAGLSFSLDDYGTGYSNMKRVIQLPLKIVKLDKSFVDEQHNPKMWIFLQNTVKMLKDMKMEIVVEGIETKEMVETFSNLECDFIQGFFFSKPICKDDFIKFIASASGIGAETNG